MSDVGISAFFNFKKLLTADHAALLIEELKRARPDFDDILPTIVLEIHDVLSDKGTGWQIRLPHQSLGCFFQLCNDKTGLQKPSWTGKIKRNYTDTALRLTARHMVRP